MTTNIAEKLAVSFSAPTTFAVGSNPQSVVTGDFNGDGKADLATANYDGHDVFVLLGDGKGGFGVADNIAMESYPRSIATGDFNNDGLKDLVISLSDSILVMTNVGGILLFKSSIAVNSDSVITADLNGDGKLDLISRSFYGQYVSVLLGNGHGDFEVPTKFSLGHYPNSVVTGDFNGDGKLDLVSVGDWDFSILLGDGKGGLSSPVIFKLNHHATSVTTADFNGDGKLDFVVANNYDTTISEFLGDGKGGFSLPTDSIVGNHPWSVSVSDFNGDGKLDLVTANEDSSDVSVLLGDGIGGFATKINFLVSGYAPTSVTTGDFNGDGKMDIVTANGKISNNVSVLLNTTTPNSLPTVTTNTNQKPTNGDDKLIGTAKGDTLNGGFGFDELTGGKGADKFVYKSIKDAPVSHSKIETITDFSGSEKDKIDLSRIDADTSKAKDQAFSKPEIGAEFSGTFTKAGQLFFDTTDHILYGNVNSDETADFAIQLNGVTSLVATDFIL